VDAPLGDNLRSDALGLAVKVVGADGYTVVFGLADLDPSFSDRTILVADAQDGASLPDDAGPFRLVIPGDARPARWVRQIRTIEIVSLKSR
jgi:hypothetical protein